MGNTILMSIPELDYIQVYWKTRIVEQTALLIPLLQLGNEKAITFFWRLKCLNMFLKMLRDYRFQAIYLTKEQLETCIRKGNELASTY